MQPNPTTIARDASASQARQTPTVQPSAPSPAQLRSTPLPPPSPPVRDCSKPRYSDDSTASLRAPPARRGYISVHAKFALALLVSAAWTALSTRLSLPWLQDLAHVAGRPLALFIVGGIALVPGMMNAFLVTSLLLDRRPRRHGLVDYPGLSILVAAYNEEASIAETIRSLAAQDYPGVFEVMVIDDGSKDATAAIVEANPQPWLRLLRQPRNMGKSAALHRGLSEAKYDLGVTLDADSCLYGDALRRLVERYGSDPADTRAVAGTMLVRNSRHNWVTRAQEWDYFHGIAAIKRVQSLFHGTMVAQGAFSIYDR